MRLTVVPRADVRRADVRRAAAVVGAVLGGALLGLGACTDGGHPAAPPRASGPVDLRVDVPPDARPQPAVDHDDGVLSVRLLYAECGIETIVGTHAEYTPQHPLCRVRLRLVNDTGGYVSFDAGAAALLEGDGSVVPHAGDVAGIERQPPSPELGGHDALEVTLWFEPPRPGRPVALRLPATRGPDGQAHPQPPVPLVWR